MLLQRQRLLDNTETLDRASRRLEHGYKITLETGMNLIKFTPVSLQNLETGSLSWVSKNPDEDHNHTDLFTPVFFQNLETGSIHVHSK